MKTTGIIMSGNHPQLILDGTKTITRRTWGLQEINKNPNAWHFTPTLNPSVWGFYQGTKENPTKILRIKCPYGQVGDHLWVKETWMMFGFGTDVRLFIHYKASEEQNGGERLLQRHTNKPLYPSLIWRSSMFMPKAYSRINLEITGVKVEHLNQISESDVIKEGVDNLVTFMLLWDRLNKKRGYEWKSNCWVWVITSKLCQ